MKKRTRQLTAQWAMAAQRLARKLGGVHRDQKQVPDPLCASRELSTEGCGNEPRPPGSQVDANLPSKELYRIGLSLGQRGRGGKGRLEAGGGPGPFRVWEGKTRPPPAPRS